MHEAGLPRGVFPGADEERSGPGLGGELPDRHHLGPAGGGRRHDVNLDPVGGGELPDHRHLGPVGRRRHDVNLGAAV